MAIFNSYVSLPEGTTISFFFQWISIIIGPEISALFQVDKLMNDLNKLVGLTKARPVFDLEKHGWVLQRRVSWKWG